MVSNVGPIAMPNGQGQLMESVVGINNSINKPKVATFQYGKCVGFRKCAFGRHQLMRLRLRWDCHMNVFLPLHALINENSAYGQQIVSGGLLFYNAVSLQLGSQNAENFLYRGIFLEAIDSVVERLHVHIILIPLQLGKKKYAFCLNTACVRGCKCKKKKSTLITVCLSSLTQKFFIVERRYQEERYQHLYAKRAKKCLY